MIILAGGKGERFGGNIPKQFVKIAGKTIIEHTIECIERSDCIDSVIIVINREYYDYMNDIVLKNHYVKVKKIIIGGTTRQDSSYAGIMACDEDTVNIMFHDAIRPFLSEEILKAVVEALQSYDAVDVAIACADTIIRVDDKDTITDIPKRKYLRRGQTPQAFKKEVIRDAYERYRKDEGVEVTDDCGIVKYYGLADIHVVYGSEQNIKVTWQEDLYLADKLFQIHSIEGAFGDRETKDVIDRIKDQVGIVIGHTSGIGKDIYGLLSEAGCSVYGFSRSNGCDITRYESVEQMFSEVYRKEGRIDYVINSAGDLRISKLESMTLEEIEDLIATDYRGVVYVTKAALPYLRRTAGSLIHFTSSSYTRGRAMYSIYSSAKAAVVNFVQAIAEEVADENIRINVMNPERTNTPMRVRNFGNEPAGTLLDSRKVAQATIRTIGTDFTGQVIDVRKEDRWI